MTTLFDEYYLLRTELGYIEDLLREYEPEQAVQLLAPKFSLVLKYIQKLEDTLVEAANTLEREDGGMPPNLAEFLVSVGIR